MDGQADVAGVGAHFDGERRFSDEVAGVWPDYAAANNAFVRWFSSNSILVTPSSWPSESERPDAVLDAFAVFYALGFSLVLGQADPGDFRIGNGRNRAHIERAISAGSDLGGNLAFTHSLVRKHRLADAPEAPCLPREPARPWLLCPTPA